MTLAEYLRKRPRGELTRLAIHLGVSKTWLSQIKHKRVPPSAALCAALEQITQGQVTRKELRPDLFGQLR
jgi:DNA-binding transcriptional regulator YdaS (Cro superfamily)